MIKDRIGLHSVLLGKGKKLPKRGKVRKMFKYNSGITCQIRHIKSTYGVYDPAALFELTKQLSNYDRCTLYSEVPVN